MMVQRDGPDDLLPALRRAQRALSRYRASHDHLVRQLTALRSEAASWRVRAELAESAPVMRAWHRARAQVDELAPAGSLRRAALKSGVRALRGALHGSPIVDPSAGVGDTGEVPVIPMALQPEVSIVVPVHDQWECTAACLRSVAASPESVGFEVIVVDDASTDETQWRLPQVTGVRPLRLEQNQGFVGAVNAGIGIARGTYVVLLNNDTEVRPGWLDALVATAESDERIGIVGGKLVYPDGRLQEAGGIIWSDASGHNYGRDQDPDDPRFSFVRDVDYCSGACLLVKAEVLSLVGGLDERFRPAYYEDTDLCFAARAQGYRVVYQPTAVVCHSEGVSHGTDVTTGVKRYQEVNREKFAEKWAETLPSHGSPDHPHVRAASWRRPSGHCLVIDHALPMPDFDSGSRRMYELLHLIDDLGFAVTFVPQNGIDLEPYRRALTSTGVEVLRSPADLDDYIKGVLPDLRLIVLSRPTVAWANYPMMRSLAPDAKLVYDTVDLHYVRERRRAAAGEETAAAMKSADYHYGMESSLIRLVDQVWVVSEPEAELLRRADPTLDVAVVPNIHQPEPAGPPFATRSGLLFVGNYAHEPNRDAAQWLVREILPLVRKELPDIRLSLAGSRVDQEIEGLAGDGIDVLGWVPDLTPHYHRARLFVAPLRYGAGMKGKVGEACAHGLPVVTTTIGAEGMDLEDGKDVLIRDEVSAFAAAIVDAYGDEALWTRLATGGQAQVLARLSPARVRADLAHTLTLFHREITDS